MIVRKLRSRFWQPSNKSQVHEKQHRVLQSDDQPLQPHRQPAPDGALQPPRQSRRQVVNVQVV